MTIPHPQASCSTCDLIRGLQLTGSIEASTMLAKLQSLGWQCDELDELICRERLDLAFPDALTVSGVGSRTATVERT